MVRGKRERGGSDLGDVRVCAVLGVAVTALVFFGSAVVSSGNVLGELEKLGEEEVYTLTVEKDVPFLEVPSQILESLSAVPEVVSGWDEGCVVSFLREDGEVEEMSMGDYLWGVVAAEMPSSFPLEALKAQVVAARTYTLKRLGSGKHGVADVCGDSGCCQAYMDVESRMEKWGEGGEVYFEKIWQAVEETDGLCVVYEGEPIDAVFFSSSWGNTMDAVEVWGSEVAYLQSVESFEGEGVPNYHSEVVFGETELRERILGVYPMVSLSEDLGTWFLEREEFSGGSVAQYLVGGVTLTGGQIRSLLGLRSTYFQVEVVGDCFVFSTVGYGHGVGMSQYGAKVLAEDGGMFHDILKWYYSGTEVVGVL